MRRKTRSGDLYTTKKQRSGTEASIFPMKTLMLLPETKGRQLSRPLLIKIRKYELLDRLQNRKYVLLWYQMYNNILIYILGCKLFIYK